MQGTITDLGWTTAVNDRSTVLAPDGLDVTAKRSFPASRTSTIRLVYTVNVFSASGVPHGGCTSVLTRENGAAPTVTGDC